ncbi:MAG TPA: hypothetical protein VGB70_10745 [Allosphingosinicella sp.]|jgi:hypothetical protein
MRICHAFAFAALCMAAPAAAVAQAAPNAAEQELAAGGAWLEQANTAMNMAAEGFGPLSAQMQALAAPGLTPAKASAAAPAIRQLIAEARAGVEQSNAMLAALSAFPVKGPLPFSPEQTLKDARAQNGRFLTLLTSYETFIAAMGKGDRAEMGRVLPEILTGAFSMMEQQRLILRNRQATVPRNQSTHQSIGIAVELYRAMELVGRGSVAAKAGGTAGANKTAATIGPRFVEIAEATRALSAAGRKNLAGELSELRAASAEAKNDADKRLLERVTRVTAAEEEMFALGDRLAALMQANGSITGPQLLERGMSQIYTGLVAMEEAFVDINAKQAGIMSEGGL